MNGRRKFQKDLLFHCEQWLGKKRHAAYEKRDPCRTRTCNPQIRSLMRFHCAKRPASTTGCTVPVFCSSPTTI
jgi:hypothetical protein